MKFSLTEKEPAPAAGFERGRTGAGIASGWIASLREGPDDQDIWLQPLSLGARSNSLEKLTDAVGGAFSPRYVRATNSLYYVAFYAGEKTDL